MSNTQHWQTGTKSCYRHTHQTRSNEKLRKSHGPVWISFQQSGRKIPLTRRIENSRRGFRGPSDPQKLHRRYLQQPTSG